MIVFNKLSLVKVIRKKASQSEQYCTVDFQQIYFCE